MYSHLRYPHLSYSSSLHETVAALADTFVAVSLSGMLGWLESSAAAMHGAVLNLPLVFSSRV